EQCLSLAQRHQDPALLLEAHMVMGVTLLQLGELTSGLEHLEHAIALYDPQQHRALTFLYGEDPGMVCLSWAALTLWCLGYPHQALERMHEALLLAQEHPFSLAFALQFAAMLHQLRREVPRAHERAEANIALSSEQGFAFWVATGMILRGWACAEQGQVQEGI